ncbi:hypothetical protein [Neobacillus massiliamazoniensis]|uniref:hypothetical protein n=1 Tax=Neobacillus massiliamazoniensis TaxID=1499688 RepID=UPI001FDFC191|nr:hypothetical protein [Neobacillus massiliamazoniensis]
MKKGKVKPSPFDPLDKEVLRAYNRGFEIGAKQQRESDIKCLIDLLDRVEEIHGIGEKTADKIREMFLIRFGK